MRRSGVRISSQAPGSMVASPRRGDAHRSGKVVGSLLPVAVPVEARRRGREQYDTAVREEVARLNNGVVHVVDVALWNRGRQNVERRAEACPCLLYTSDAAD